MPDLILDTRLQAADVKAALALAPHPEGGWYRETFRDLPEGGGRGAATAILFLLAAGEESAPHRVDAAEIWLFHAGAPLALRIGESEVILGPGLPGQTLQAVVPKFIWQSARSLGPWSLVSCVVAPAFTFDGFELAPAPP
jgi:predicted cupin superfamily sugar epimerase